MPLSPEEIESIKREAEKVYPITGGQTIAFQHGQMWIRKGYIAAKTEDAERIKDVVSEIESAITGKTPATEMDIAYQICLRIIKNKFPDYSKSINNGKQ